MVEFSFGIYPVYKPKGISTYDIIRIIKRKFKKKVKIGHAGTLDPLAEGVVVVGIGRQFTKKLHKLLNDSQKEYIAEILLDVISDTHDVESELKKISIEKIPTLDEIKEVLKSFIGEIEQYPPVFSAKKYKGERICDLVRRGKLTIEEAKKLLKPKKIKILNIEILEYNFPKIILKITCSSGTYIRALARDIGEKLKCGGVIKNLLRVRIDSYKIEDAIKL